MACFKLILIFFATIISLNGAIAGPLNSDKGSYISKEIENDDEIEYDSLMMLGPSGGKFNGKKRSYFYGDEDEDERELSDPRPLMMLGASGGKFNGKKRSYFYGDGDEDERELSDPKPLLVWGASTSPYAGKR
uniref:Uncharacterized protein n=1 Tax=Clytia hemisphaerica TaxID=252671 RepID=A0A7M5XEB6_9CNID